VIQKNAQEKLAKDREVGLEKVPWPIGSIHDLRKTYCTRMAEAGVPMNALQQWAGHSNPKTTMAYYTATTEAMAERGRTALAALYGSDSCARLARDSVNAGVVGGNAG
jgi:integrase